MSNSTNTLLCSIDIENTIITKVLKNKSSKWTIIKILKMSGKLSALNYSEESYWSYVNDLKALMSHYFRISGELLLQSIKMHEYIEITDKVESMDSTASKPANPDTCDNFYELLHLLCVEYLIKPPIILYGRLFEEQRFQYVSFIFRQHVFIIEISTDFVDTQGRACEAMYALIRKCEGIPKVSMFLKIERDVARIVAEIDMQDTKVSLYSSTPKDLVIMDLYEIFELITASQFLLKFSYSSITNNCVQTLIYKQPFLERMCINKRIFGCVNPLEKSTLQMKNQIILVLCDTTTQSNFLWNNKPLTVTAESLFCDADDMTKKVSFQHIDLQPMNVSSNEPGGIYFGDQILYERPYDEIFD